MKKDDQNVTTPVGSGRVTPKKKSSSEDRIVTPSLRDLGLPEWALPESVTIALGDLAETATEGLLALAVGTGCV